MRYECTKRDYRKHRKKRLEQKKEYYKANKQLIKKRRQAYVESKRKEAAANTRAWYRANKDKAAASARKTRFRSLYGITIEEYEVEAKRQGGRCSICGRKAKLCVDHCHDSKKFRGLLCRKCNSGLGMFCDDLKILKRAELYLLDALKSHLKGRRAA